MTTKTKSEMSEMSETSEAIRRARMARSINAVLIRSTGMTVTFQAATWVDFDVKAKDAICAAKRAAFGGAVERIFASEGGLLVELPIVDLVDPAERLASTLATLPAAKLTPAMYEAVGLAYDEQGYAKLAVFYFETAKALRAVNAR